MEKLRAGVLNGANPQLQQGLNPQLVYDLKRSSRNCRDEWQWEIQHAVQDKDRTLICWQAEHGPVEIRIRLGPTGTTAIALFNS